MKIVFMGSDPIALPLLECLANEPPGGVELAAVFTQPDRKTGRGMKLKANEIKRWATERTLPVHQPLKCGPEFADFFKDNGIELAIVMAYGQILPKRLLEAVPLGFINLHASILPRLRGASPIHTAVALGLEETGVSLMRIIPKMDAGPVADIERVPIKHSDQTADVHARLAEASPLLLRRNLPALVSGTLNFAEQDSEQVTYCRIIEKQDAHLDFAMPASELVNRIRAFQPWPGTQFPFEGVDVRILAAEFNATDSGQAPGTVLPSDQGTLLIACGTGTLEATHLQRPGGKPLSAAEFLRGFAIQAGTVIESRPMHPIEGQAPFPYRAKRNSPPSRS